MQTKQEPVDSF